MLNLPSRHDEVATPILLVAVFRCFTALRTFLSVAYRVDSSGIDAERNEVVLHSIGTAITQAQVVLFAAALVAMAFNAELDSPNSSSGN